MKSLVAFALIASAFALSAPPASAQTAKDIELCKKARQPHQCTCAVKVGGYVRANGRGGVEWNVSHGGSAVNMAVGDAYLKCVDGGKR